MGTFCAYLLDYLKLLKGFVLKITVVGLGYVGASIAVLLARQHQVVALDLMPERVDAINHRRSPIQDEVLAQTLAHESLDLIATLDRQEAYANAEYVVIATPTNFDPDTNQFDTSTVEAVIADVLSIEPQATMIIKSTIPVGFTNKMRAKFNCNHIIFSPEFLREGKALHDNLYPSRIIV
jgi:UDPglucose 6-dehydrogenase